MIDTSKPIYSVGFCTAQARNRRNNILTINLKALSSPILENQNFAFTKPQLSFCGCPR